MQEKIRLDQYLLSRGYFNSRSRAQDAIRRGAVYVDNNLVQKTGFLVNISSSIIIKDPAINYVSRAALKLKTALDHFGLDVTDLLALDIGASTGGFTQLLCERNIKKVIAIDVGHGQFAPFLLQDSRIRLIERLNARDLTLQHLADEQINLIVCDVSFISLKLALPPSLDLAAKGAKLLALLKPQFEAGKKHLNKNGVVADKNLITKIIEDMVNWLNNYDSWRVNGVVACEIKGQDGNQEYIIYAEKINS